MKLQKRNKSYKKLPNFIECTQVNNDGFVIIGEKGKEIIEIVKKNKTQGYKLKVSFGCFHHL